VIPVNLRFVFLQDDCKAFACCFKISYQRLGNLGKNGPPAMGSASSLAAFARELVPVSSPP
jgi:hypothetical protein